MKKLIFILLLLPSILFAQFDGNKVFHVDTISGMNDDVVIKGNIKSTDAIHLFSYFGDSTITYSFASSDTWYHMTNASNDMWIDSELDGFSVSNDTITVENPGDYDLRFKVNIIGGNGTSYAARFYNVTQAKGIPVSGAITGRGSGNVQSLTISAYAEGIDENDEIVIQIKADATQDATFKASTIKIYLIHI